MSLIAQPRRGQRTTSLAGAHHRGNSEFQNPIFLALPTSVRVSVWGVYLKSLGMAGSPVPMNPEGPFYRCFLLGLARWEKVLLTCQESWIGWFSSLFVLSSLPASGVSMALLKFWVNGVHWLSMTVCLRSKRVSWTFARGGSSARFGPPPFFFLASLSLELSVVDFHQTGSFTGAL